MMNIQPLTLQEILRQPDAWQQAIDTMDELAPALTSLMRTAAPDVYLFTGCGTSYYLAMVAASFFQEATGLAARAVPASELILSRSTFIPAGQKAALFAFSRSGTTTETVVALRQHQREALGPTVSITCRAGSPMESMGDLAICLPAADDQSVVMTSSFTSMLMASLLAAGALSRNWEPIPHLRSLPGLLREHLATQQALAERIGQDRKLEHFIFLGFGPFFGAACEGMLKLKEMTQVPCEAYSPLEFRHGPIATVGAGTLAVLLASDRAGEQERTVLRDIRNLGGKVLYVGGETPAADFACAAGVMVPEAARLLLHMPLLQFMAYYRAMALDRDPDRPQHLTQVVTLDEQELVRTRA
jgi:glucosamine--fructose-6-phosphate aminotransferase (isomerizing)